MDYGSFLQTYCRFINCLLITLMNPFRTFCLLSVLLLTGGAELLYDAVSLYQY